MLANTPFADHSFMWYLFRISFVADVAASLYAGGDELSSDATFRNDDKSGSSVRLRSFFDGKHTMDMVCCELAAPLADAQRTLLAYCPSCVWVHR